MAVKNTLATRQQKQTFSTYLTADAVKNKINEIVGGENGQRFITSLVSSVASNPMLAKCDHASLLSCALLGETLKLSPSPQLGHYYMVPYDDNKRGITIAQFQLGYKGYIQLAERSGYYKKINVLSIKDGELVKYDPLEETIEVNLIEDDEQREAANSMGYYAMFEYHNGFRKTMYWSHKKMEVHAVKYSKGYAADKKKGTSWTFWSKDFDGMAYKTMLRQLISKWGIMSIEMQQAFDADVVAEVSADGAMSFVENANQQTETVDAVDVPFDAVSGESAEANFFDGVQ